MSCDHRKNAAIVMDQRITTEITIVDGQAGVASGDPSITGLELHCHGCGAYLNWHASRVPKWVLAMIAQSHPDRL